MQEYDMGSKTKLIKEQLQTAKLFRNVRSQAVRLPAKYRFPGNEVFIAKEGDRVILWANPSSWDDFFAAERRVPVDFMSNRKDVPSQKRKLFK